MESKLKSHPFLLYVAGLLTSAFGLILQAQLENYTQSEYLALYPSVFISAYFLGRGPAVLTVALCLAGRFVINDFTLLREHYVGYLFFTVFSTLISLIVSRDRSRQAQESSRNLQLLKEREYERSRFEAIMKQMPGAVIVGEAPSGKLIFANQKMKEVWGHELKNSNDIQEYGEWIGFHPDGRRYEGAEWPLARSIAAGEYVSNEDVDIIRGDGLKAVLRLNSAPILDKSGKVIAGVVICQDVTTLKQAILARDEFLSIASHELKTPLTSLHLQFQLQKRGIEKKDPRAYTPERIEQLSDQSYGLIQRLIRLVDDMLDISRMRTGKLRISKSEVDLKEITEEVLSRMKGQFEEAGIKVNFSSDGDANGVLDAFRIEQVITNLLTNALKFGVGSPVDVKISVEDSEALLTIRDYGQGISESFKPKLFQQFERGISANEVSGLGLGLYICKQIVEAHQGQIWMESREGEGATSFVKLPLRRE